MRLIPCSKRVLILCEDSKSSLFYFKSFKKDEKLKRELSAVNIEVIHPKNYSPVGLVKAAIKMKNKARRDRNPYNEIWIVLDKDEGTMLKEAAKLASDNKINGAISIICFEFWILLHFEKTLRAYDNCEGLIKYLNGKINNYQKKLNYYNLLRDKITKAISNGEWVEKQVQNEIDRGLSIYDLSAYTNVHHLVKKLLNPELFGIK